jgi:hypothetical protein
MKGDSKVVSPLKAETFAKGGGKNNDDTGPTAGKNSGYAKKGAKAAMPSLDPKSGNPMNDPPSTYGIGGV